MITTVVPSAFFKEYPFYGYRKSCSKLQFHIVLDKKSFNKIQKDLSPHCNEKIIACNVGNNRHLGGTINLRSSFVDTLVEINRLYRDKQLSLTFSGN